MDPLAPFILMAIVAALAYVGFLRPTGLLGRRRADEETERQRDAAARVLKKIDEASDQPSD